MYTLYAHNKFCACSDVLPCKTRSSRISSNTYSGKHVAHTPPQTPAIDCRRLLHFPLTSSHRHIRSLLAPALLRPSSAFSAKAPLRFKNHFCLEQHTAYNLFTIPCKLIHCFCEKMLCTHTLSAPALAHIAVARDEN